MIIALGLVAALSGPALSSPAPSQAAPPPPPRVERDVRIVRVDGPEGGPHGGLARLDKDGDGFISREEYVGPTETAFGVLDKNRDGRISTEELAEGRAVARTILGGAGGPGPMGGPLSGPMGGRGAVFIGGPDGPDGLPGGTRFMIRRDGQDGAPAVIHMNDGDGPGDLDADKDGKVSEEEFLAPLRQAFRSMDKDGSGSLEDGEHGSGSNVRIVTRRVERSAD